MPLSALPRRLLLVLVLILALAGAVITSARRQVGMTASLTARGLVLRAAPPAPAGARDMEREIEAASDTVRDFAARHPLPR